MIKLGIFNLTVMPEVLKKKKQVMDTNPANTGG